MILSFTNLFLFLFSLTTFLTILRYTTVGEISTTFIWIVSISMLGLGLFLKLKVYNKFFDGTSFWSIKLFLFWNIICVTRGFYISENYWETKNLITVMFMMLVPFFSYLFINPEFVKKILSFWYKYMIWLVFLFVPIIVFNDFVGRYLAPIMFLLLVFPLLSKKWKLIAVFFTLFVFISGLDARSNILRFSAALSLGLLFYFRFLLVDKFFKFLHFILLLLPLILLILGLLNIFNVFKMDEYIKGDFTVKTVVDGKSVDGKLTQDTRTFIYVETINSAIKNDYVLFGRTPANGYDSTYFGDYNKYELGTGKQQRFSSEVSILNFFTWNGLIGVVIYFLVFLHSSYLSIYKSNNYYIKIIGLFVTFRWALSFIEDFNLFDIQYLFLWILISMCYSKSFREMNDNQFKTWLIDLLNKSTLIKIRS